MGNSPDSSKCVATLASRALHPSQPEQRVTRDRLRLWPWKGILVTHRRFGSKSRWQIATIVALWVLSLTATSYAQYNMVPYYGKNRVKYDKFEWHIYTTDHFEIYYYPELEEHLERVASYAESAYQQISADLRHELPFIVPLIVFKTHSEFEQQNLIPGASPEGVGAFAEPQRNRIVLPIDEPPDGLYRLIMHELTHIFEFDIIPRSIIRNTVPLWVDEGLSDFLAGVWRPLDLMEVRDVALADIVPSMTQFDQYGGFASGRVVYNLGHAVFEFIEERWGREGIRQFLFALRRNAIGGGEDPYEEALGLPAQDFDDAFKAYLDDRFDAFRDKERPADYGRDLAPDPLQSRYPVVYSVEASPTGEIVAAMAVDRKDREADIVLLSARTGEVIDNLTEGFNQNFGFQYIPAPGSRWITVPWMSWSPSGDHMAYMVRKQKHKALVIQNIVTKEIEDLIDLDMVDEPESPDFSTDGRKVVFSALNRAVGNIYEIDLDTYEVTNLTNNEFADYAPFYSPDGSFIVHMSRVSGNNKLFRLDLETGERTQLTFGTHDEAGGQFLDDRTIVFASTAVDPTQPIEPETARDGEIFNIWTLDLVNGELQQLTDNATAVVNPVVLAPDRDSDNMRIGFITYYKAEYGLHTIELGQPLYTAQTSDFGTAGPTIDFQAPLTHTINLDNSRRKGRFENMYLESRPAFGVGLTNSGDVLGSTQITLADILGDQQFSAYIYSISQYRTYGGSYANLSGRFQYAIQGSSSEQFFFGYLPNTMFSSAFGFLSRDDAIATRRTQGGNMVGIYPFDRFRRLELTAGIFNFRESFADEALQQQSNLFQEQQFGTQLFRNGNFAPLGVRFVQETTVLREYGPVSGNTLMFGYDYAPSLGPFLSRQVLNLDARHYFRILENGVLAFRARGFKSWGEFPDFTFFGGQSEMRGYDYLQFLGHKSFFGNMELRFPLIEAMATPIGVLGGIRGTFFFNVGVAGFNGEPLNAWSRDPVLVRPVTGFRLNPATAQAEQVFGDPVSVTGFRLNNARASYGVGLTTFAIGFPVHFDWSWLTLFNREWEDVMFAAEAAREGRSRGSDLFRNIRFQMWIGYDF